MTNVARMPPGLLVGRYHVLRKHLTDGVTLKTPHTPEIKSAIVGALSNIWNALSAPDRAELAVTLARMGAEPVTIEEAAELAALVEGDALALRREARSVAKILGGAKP